MDFLLINFTGTSIDWSNVVTIILSAATVLVSGVTVYFARKQVEIAKMQRKDNLYDKRYAVYKKYREFATSVIDEKNKINKHRNLLREAMFHEFLFNDDMKIFMDEIWNKYNEEIGVYFIDGSICVQNNEIKYYRDEEVRNKYCKIVSYFMDKFHFDLRDKFEPYLKL